MQEVDKLVKEEKLLAAIRSYQNLLEREPDNAQIKQRLEEVKRYASLLKKDHKALIKRLENFLGVIKSRS